MYNYKYILDGQPIDSVPVDENYVVFARHTEDESVWLRWDHSTKKFSDDVDASKACVYMFSVEKLYPSVAEMTADTSLAECARVGTVSYYDSLGRGGAVYEISAEGSESAIGLDNGLYASIVPFAVGEERIVTVDMFGAYGDGEHMDHKAIMSAFAYERANVVEFESGIYLQNATITLCRGNVKVNGKGAKICNSYFYRDDPDVINNDFVIKGQPDAYLKDITVCHLELNCTETHGAGTLYKQRDHFQFDALFTEGLTVRNCRFIAPDVPETHISCVNFRMTKDTLFENNTIKSLSKSTEYSGGLWFWSDSDFKYGSKNITVRGNYIEKTSHDEVVAFFMGEFDGILFENNTVYTHDEPAGHGSHHAVGFGVWDCPTTVKNAIFRNNKFNVVVKNDWMMFSNVENIKVYNNEINMTGNSPEEPINYGVFRVTCIAENYKKAGIPNVSQKNVEIFNNKINVRNSKEIPMNFNCEKGFDIHDNEYTFELISPAELGKA